MRPDHLAQVINHLNPTVTFPIYGRALRMTTTLWNACKTLNGFIHSSYLQCRKGNQMFYLTSFSLWEMKAKSIAPTTAATSIASSANIAIAILIIKGSIMKYLWSLCWICTNGTHCFYGTKRSANFFGWLRHRFECFLCRIDICIKKWRESYQYITPARLIIVSTKRYASETDFDFLVSSLRLLQK